MDEETLKSEAREAVKFFWDTRKKSGEKNANGERADQGRRGEATNGQAMDRFVTIMQNVVKESGFKDARVGIKRGAIALPGYYRPSKQWDLVVTREDRIVAAIEFKSHMGLKDLGKNYNNRNEEVVGSATDFWATLDLEKYDDNLPFLGWFLLVEDSHESQRTLTPRVSYGSVDKEFRDAGFLKRYDILCKRLEEKGLYGGAGVMGVSEDNETTGEYFTVTKESSFERFAIKFHDFLVNEAKVPDDPEKYGRLI